MSNPFDSANASRTLKIAGIVLILSFFVDFVLLLFPFRPTDQTWLIELATALVDRGIVPMVGLGMLLAGYGLDPDEGKSSPVDIRFPALILSTVLGIMFLLIFPLHVNNVLKVSEQRVADIGKSADQAEAGVKTQLQQLQAQLSTDAAKAELEKQRNLVKAQFSDLLKDDQKYKQALENPQVPPAQKELLKKFKANPAELEKFIAQQSDPQQIANQRISQIIQQKEDAQNQARQQASKSGLRIGISSLLLAIGYSIIGWTGLRSFGSGVSSSARKAPAR
jgi:hypothetical protein